MALETTIKINADVSGASKGIKSLKEGSKKAFKGMKSGIAGAAKGLAVFSLAAEGAGKIFAGLEKAFDRMAQSSRDIARAKIFKVSTKDAKQFNKALGNSLSRMQALAQLTDLKALGFSNEDAVRAAKMSRVLAVITGQTRDQALAMLKSGEASSKVLENLNLHSSTLEFDLKNRRDAAGRELTQLEKSKVLMDLIANGSGIYRKNIVNASKADIVSPFRKFKNLMVNVADALIKKILPFFSQLVKKSGGIDKVADRVVSFFTRVFDKIKTMVSWIQKAAKQGFLSTVWKLMKGEAAKLASSLMIPGHERALPTLKKKPSSQQTLLQELKARMKREGTGGPSGLIKLPKRPKRIPTDEEKEIAEELQGFRVESRTITRNFFANFLQFTSNLGGTISGVFSGLKDLPEFMATMTTSPVFMKALKKVDFIGKSTITNEMMKIQKMKTAGKLTDKQARQMSLYVMMQRAGLDDQKEYLNNQKLVTKELAASLNPLASAARLQQLATLARDKEVDVNTAQRQLQAVLIAGKQKEKKLVEEIATGTQKQSERAHKILLSHDLTIKRLTTLHEKYKAISAEQQKLIGINLKIATIDAMREKLLTEIANKTALIAGDAENKKLKIELLGLQGKDIKLQQIQMMNAEKLRAIAARRVDLEEKLRFNTLKSNTLFNEGRTKESATFEARAVQNAKQLAGLKKTADAQKLINQQSVDNYKKTLGFMGGMRAGFAAEIQLAKDGTADMAKMVGMQMADVVKKFGSFAAQTFERVGVSLALAFSGKDDAFGEDMMKSFLNFIGEAAAQFAGFFGSMGAAYLAMGNIGQGVALLAASAGLGVIAGLAKGGAGQIGGGGAQAAAGATTSPAMQTGLGNQPTRGQQTQEIIVVLNSMPWNGDERTQARRFRDFLKKNRRTVGSLI